MCDDRILALGILYLLRIYMACKCNIYHDFFFLMNTQTHSTDSHKRTYKRTRTHTRTHARTHARLTEAPLLVVLVIALLLRSATSKPKHRRVVAVCAAPTTTAGVAGAVPTAVVGAKVDSVRFKPDLTADAVAGRSQPL